MNLPPDHRAQEQAQENDCSKQTKMIFQPAPWKSFLALGVVSLGLHLLVLRMPIPAIQPVSKVNQPIEVTRLATAPKPKRPVLKASSSKTLEKAAASVRPSRLRNRPVSASAIAPIRKLDSPTPAVASRPQTKASTSQSSASQSSASRSSASASPKPKQSQNIDADFKDFPTYPGSDLSPESPALSTTDPFEKVVAFFDKKLEDQKQKWNPQVASNEPSGSKVYQISKGEATKFLNVFSKGQLGTAYVLTDKPTTLEALAEAEAAIASISDALGSLKALEQVDASRTAQPKLFQRNDSEIVSMNLTETSPPEKVFTDYLSNSLAQQRFEVSKPSAYGGGPVYILNRGQFTGYLNLVPSQDGTGTVIVFWKVPPA
jgi:hypothetical protein